MRKLATVPLPNATTALDLADQIQTRISKAQSVVRAFACAQSEPDGLCDGDPAYIAQCVTDLLNEAHDMVFELHRLVPPE